jgi:group I intron endonuclease
MKKIPVIYCFHCILTGKKYIGKSISISARLTAHRRNVKNNVITKFYCSVRKYGWNNFIFGIIEECDKNILDEREIFYIEKYKTLSEGYNMTAGGDGGATWNEETKRKISQKLKGKKPAPMSDEAKKKLSLERKGVPRNRDIVNKMMRTREINQSFIGKNNPNSKTFIFTSPERQQYRVEGKFKTFCAENNLSLWGMNNFLKTGKMVNGCKGWTVKRND